jgi:hypothetical protein
MLGKYSGLVHIEDLDQLGDELLECFLMPKRTLQHMIQTFLLCLQLLALATSCKLAIKELKKWMAPEEVGYKTISTYEYNLQVLASTRS